MSHPGMPQGGGTTTAGLAGVYPQRTASYIPFPLGRGGDRRSTERVPIKGLTKKRIAPAIAFSSSVCARNNTAWDLSRGVSPIRQLALPPSLQGRDSNNPRYGLNPVKKCQSSYLLPPFHGGVTSSAWPSAKCTRYTLCDNLRAGFNVWTWVQLYAVILRRQ